MHDKVRIARTLLVLLLTVVFLVPLSGCIVAAAASVITAVALAETAEDEAFMEGDYTLTAEVGHDADSVYASALRLNEEHPDVTVTYQWERSLRIDAVRDLDLVSLKMTPVDERSSQLIIEARSGDAVISNEELAWQTLTTICDDLSVRYVVLSGESELDGQQPVAGDVPVDDEMVLAEEMPLDGELDMAEETPLAEEASLTEEAPLEEDLALIVEAPLAEETPLVDEPVVIVEPTGVNGLGLPGSARRDTDLGPTGEEF